MRIGIDLGGTKIEGVVLSDSGAVHCRQRIATPKGDYSATIAALNDLVVALEERAGQCCTVGLATPGAVWRGLMKNCNSTCLNGRPFKADLERALGREVKLANDADCLVLSESMDGAAAGFATVFGVILGTGVGGGWVVNGRLLQGPNAIAGEWGHNPLPWAQAGELPGELCYCGLSGCIETYLCGPALDGSCAGLTAEQVGRRETPEAQAAMEMYCHRLARALASVINVVDPDVIVLAGGVSNIDYLYERVPQLWKQWVFTEAPVTKLVKAKYGDSSGVRGAAWLWG